MALYWLTNPKLYSLIFIKMHVFLSLVLILFFSLNYLILRWFSLHRVDASGEEFYLMLQMAIINHYAYKPTDAELPPGSVFSRGCFSFAPPVGSVKWTKVPWACLIITSSSFTTTFNRTLPCVDPSVPINLHFHIHELFFELIYTFGQLM